MSRGKREPGSSIRKYVLREAKGQVFRRWFGKVRAYTSNVYPCFVYSRDIPRINPIRYMLLLRKKEREFSKCEEIYEQRTEFRQSNIYIFWMAALSFFHRVIDEATETRWNSEKTRVTSLFSSPSFFYYFGNYPLLAYAYGNLPCY